MREIVMHPIGIIHSPYAKSKDIPIQGKFKDNVEAFVELNEEFVPGLKDFEKLQPLYSYLLFS